MTIVTPEQLQSIGAFNAQLQKYAPDFKGPITPEESVKHIVSVWEKASLENGDGGSFVSHHGNQQWL